MFGCVRAVGCLTLAALTAGGAFVTRDLWLPRLTGRPTAEAMREYEQVTTAQSTGARRAVESLGERSGPVFANLTAAEVSSLVLADAEKAAPGSIRDGEAAVVGDRLALRATVDVGSLKGVEALGPLASMIEGRQRVSFSGTLDVVAPGLAQFIVEQARVGDFIIPSPIIPALIAQIDRRSRPAGVAPGGIPFTIPPYVGDIRVGKGRVTFYRNVS